MHTNRTTNRLMLVAALVLIVGSLALARVAMKGPSSEVVPVSASGVGTALPATATRVATARPTATTAANLPPAQPRSPYQKPSNPTLQVELNISASELGVLQQVEHLVLPAGATAEIWTTNESNELGQLYLEVINQTRVKQGLSPLSWDTDLAARAEGYASTRLWYWVMDEGRTVYGPREREIQNYYGINRTDYPAIGVSSGLAPTKLFDQTPNLNLVKSDVVSTQTGQPVYGAATLPDISRVGIAVVMAKNTTADVPIGWLTILFQ